MIGRQELLVRKVELEKNFRQFGLSISDNDRRDMFAGKTNYAEGFLRTLGAKEIVSFDASAYEGASIIHDLNQPISHDQKGRFSAVLDGGTLEHVFNFPDAIRNCMEMVSEDGHFLAITPTNNHAGHGFYQFSPELFFRIFCAENGFELEHLIVFEETLNSPWYEVTDPQTINERVMLVNENPTMLLIIARKVRTVEIFGSVPQQSDYLTAWNTGNRPKHQLNATSKIGRIPAAILRRIKMRIDRKTGMLNRRHAHYRKVQLP